MLLRQNIIYAGFFTLGLLLPDITLGYLTKTLTCSIPLTTLCGVVIFSWLISFVRNGWFLGLIIALIMTTQAIQLCHWAYFGAPIHSQDISKVFLEIDEIAHTGTSVFCTLWPVWASLGSSLALLLAGHIVCKKRKSIAYAWVLILIILSISPIISTIKGRSSFYTKPTSSTIYNTLRAFANWIVHARSIIKEPNYRPYTISYDCPKVRNIVLIMGESLSSRYMQLYGYDKLNTPFLNTLKRDPNFKYTRGVSGSVSTITSLQLFFNSFHNPGFLSLIRKKDANLLRLAKHQGYKTFLLSAQNEKLFHDVGTEFIDFMTFEKNIQKSLKEKGDEALLDSLKALTLTDKNFIVIHLRHIHSPFELYKKYNPRLDYATKSEMSRTEDTQQNYSNAILYHDSWVQDCICVIRQILPSDTIVLFTSDHGQLVGERGLYGHNLMEPEVADVPIWALALDADPSHIQFSSNSCFSHYDLAKQIGKLMGATIINPNEDNTYQYVHGSEIYGNYAFLKWQKIGQKPQFSAKHWLE